MHPAGRHPHWLKRVSRTLVAQTEGGQAVTRSAPRTLHRRRCGSKGCRKKLFRARLISPFPLHFFWLRASLRSHLRQRTRFPASPDARIGYGHEPRTTFAPSTLLADLRVDGDPQGAHHSPMDPWDASRCDGDSCSKQRLRLLPSSLCTGLLLALLVGCGLTESLDGYGGGTLDPQDAGVDQGNAGSGGDASTSDSGGSAGDSSVEDSPDDTPADGSDDTSEPDVSADGEAGLDATEDVSEDSPMDVSQDVPAQETGPDAPADSSTCPATQKLCNGQCVAVSDPAYGCGSTGCTPCPTPSHASATCQGTTCSAVCVAGWGDCNNSMTDGCEINTKSNVLHCGSCDQACSTNRVTPACENGNCTGTCASGYGDCNNDLRTDGCEVNVSTNTDHCGACGRACSTSKVKTGGLSCSLGLCDTTECNAAWTNVTMPPAPEPDDGCETPI